MEKIEQIFSFLALENLKYKLNKDKLMRKIIYLVVFLLVINLAFAGNFFDNEKAVIELSISSEITVVPTSSHSSIKSLEAKLSFYPFDDGIQKVESIETTPGAEEINNTLVFEWKNPEEEVIPFSCNAKVETKNTLEKTYTKIHFPIINIPEEVIIHTLPSENIDSDNEWIVKTSSSLAEGESDLYAVVYSLAVWIKDNVDYSLDSSTESVSQKASWVLKNKKGVCDEITSLFIAFCRALKIPAKYVSGVAYTNYNELNDFGAHAWAEVYIANKWIPFDITYNQMGYIDSSHIKLRESHDSASPSTSYEWSGVNVDIETKELSIKAKTKQKTGKTEKLISISSRPIKQSTGFNSYNLIEAELENPNGFYVISSVAISKTGGIEIGEIHKDVLLKPFEAKKVFWIVKTEGLNENYVYTFPILVYTSRNETSLTEFSSSLNEPVYTIEEIKSIIEEKKDETEKTYSKNVELECSPEKGSYYLYEIPVIKCAVKNIGNVFLEDVNICLNEDCSIFDIGITQKKEFTFEFNPLEKGKRDVKITAINSQVSKAAYAKVNILDEPKVAVNKLDYPLNVSYEDEYDVSFILDKSSTSIPKKIIVKFFHDTLSEEWEIAELNSDQNFVIKSSGKGMSIGKNNFRISVGFEDDNGRKYKTEESFAIILNKPTLIQRIVIFFNDVSKWVLGLFQ